jgi:hypothetical protein
VPPNVALPSAIEVVEFYKDITLFLIVNKTLGR